MICRPFAVWLNCIFIISKSRGSIKRPLAFYTLFFSIIWYSIYVKTKTFDDKKTIVQPDLSVICDPGKLTERGCSGAPDWIIEIVSPSALSHDYVRKLNLYLDAGVKEYCQAFSYGVSPQTGRDAILFHIRTKKRF